MPRTFKLLDPEFCSATICGALVVPISWLPKLSELGVTLAPGVPVEVTVSVAALLAALPTLLLTTTTNCAPLSDEVVAGVAYVAEVAPGMLVPFFCHWYRKGPEPLATTENVAVCPTATLWFTGWEVIDGAVRWTRAQLTPQIVKVAAKTKAVTRNLAK
jgi:hypothetical protein